MSTARWKKDALSAENEAAYPSTEAAMGAFWSDATFSLGDVLEHAKIIDLHEDEDSFAEDSLQEQMDDQRLRVVDLNTTDGR